MTEALPIEKPRIHSIDILRGIIMIIMALDHVRDFFSNAPFDPLDLSKTTVPYYFTRWVTHLCAPTFIFLSGASAYLSLAKRKTTGEASRFLLTRGLWLIFLELTVIGFGWQFDIGFHNVFAQVIWAIGWSMVILSALIYLKPQYVCVFGLILIFGHNLLDPIKAASFGRAGIFWMFIHETSFYKIHNYESVFMLYPIVPWVGVMACGYAFGKVFKFELKKRRRTLLLTGLISLSLFIVIRLVNIYGDPLPWHHQNTALLTFLDFMRVNKYPPSLLYLLSTLGISLTALALLDSVNTPLSQLFEVYGRVPMFYYILHIYLIHITQLVIGLIVGQKQTAALGNLGKQGFSLPVVYLTWLLIVLSLYYPCRWFMRIKQQRRDWWLSYI